MRLVAGLLALTLFASFARAEDARLSEPPRTAETNHGKVPVRVVRVMPESHQALLFDRSRATHVLVEVGGQIDGYTVDAIDEDEVTLSLGGAQVVLVAPPRASRRRDHDTSALHARPVAARQPDTRAAAPVDPYGEPAVRVVEAPGSPGARTSGVSRAIEAGDGGVRVAVAPGGPGGTTGGAAGSTAMTEGPTEVLPSDTSIRVAEAPADEPPAPSASSASSPSATAPLTPAPSSPSVAPASALERAPAVRAVSAATPDKKTVDARAMADLLSTDSGRRHPRMPSSPSGASPSVESTTGEDASSAPASDIRTTAAPGAIVLARGEVDGALADFAKLTTAVHGSFSAAGIVLDHVTDGTIFQHAGLRSGDVITAVDGVRLRSLDDAANLYARASTARALTAQILRGGVAMTIRVTIQ